MGAYLPKEEFPLLLEVSERLAPHPQEQVLKRIGVDPPAGGAPRALGGACGR